MSQVTFDMNKTKAGKRNYAYTTVGRTRETLRLTDALIDDEDNWLTIPVLHPSTMKETIWTSESLPAHDDHSVATAREALKDGKPIHIKLEVPLEKTSTSETGRATVIITKSNHEDDSIQLWNRGHISLLHHTNRHHGSDLPGYSSLLYIELSDPLSDAIVCTEGPAHLMMDRSEGRFEQNYNGNPSNLLIDYLLQAPATILGLIQHEPTEAVDWLQDLFTVVGQEDAENENQGQEDDDNYDDIDDNDDDDDDDDNDDDDDDDDDNDDDDIERHIKIDLRSTETEHGFTIQAQQDAPDLTGNSYVVRVLYGDIKDHPLNPSIPPDNRIPQFDMETMVTCVGSEFFVDVTAANGGVCPDRFRLEVNEQDFTVEIRNLDLMKWAQCQVDLMPDGGDGE